MVQVPLGSGVQLGVHPDVGHAVIQLVPRQNMGAVTEIPEVNAPALVCASGEVVIGPTTVPPGGAADGSVHACANCAPVPTTIPMPAMES